MTEQPGPRAPSLMEALVPLVAIGLFLAVGYAYLGWRIEVMLLAAGAVAGAVGWRLGYTWKDMEAGIIEALGKGLPAIMILITVGALIASWLASGTIPLMVYYGLELISPRFFLVTACIICSLVSVFTGTSWGTVGTVGVALMGVAQGLGVNPAAAAGAVVSGAYFGDKLSPFSDTTNLAPVVARSNLFDHIRWLLWTTGPAWILGLVVYLVVGFGAGGSGSTADVDALQGALREAYRFHVLLLVPPVLMLGLAVRSAPILPGMLLSSLVAVILAVWLQGEGLGAALDADLTLLVLCAFGFAGIMRTCGLLDRILASLLGVVKSTLGLVSATVGSGVLTAVVTGSSYLSIIVPGDLFQDAFRKADLAAKNLSRTLEDSGTVVVPLVPWSAAGSFMAGTVGVATVSYLPWAVMNYTGFLFALVLAATGVGIAPRIRDDETQPGS
jgi:NhaC family Na+:H+ antiporter